jgi:hypothetical protein
MGFIDAHVHVWSDDAAHYPPAPGWKKEDVRPQRFTPEELFKHTRPADADRINLIQMSYYYLKDLSGKTVDGVEVPEPTISRQSTAPI